MPRAGQSESPGELPHQGLERPSARSLGLSCQSHRRPRETLGRHILSSLIHGQGQVLSRVGSGGPGRPEWHISKHFLGVSTERGRPRRSRDSGLPRPHEEAFLIIPLEKGSASFQPFKGFVSPKDSEAVHGRPSQRRRLQDSSKRRVGGG